MSGGRMDGVERTIAALGTHIRVIGSGPADGEPVLCIHGVGGWAENWRETLAALAAAGYRGIAFDLPGFGESGGVRRARYFRGPDALYARVIPTVMDALDLRDAHIVGHSLGGAVAYISTVSAPDRVRSLTLVAPAGLGLDLPWTLRLGSVPLIGGLLSGRSREAARAGLASCFHDPSRIPRALLEECDRYAPRSIPETLRVLRAGVTLRGVRRGIRAEWMSRATRYTGPVQLVWGTDDIVLPVRHADGVTELFPRAPLHRIADAGHLVMVEQPAAFMRALLPFLASAKAVVSR